MTRIDGTSSHTSTSSVPSRSEAAQQAADVINETIRVREGGRPNPLDHISVNPSPDTTKTAKGRQPNTQPEVAPDERRNIAEEWSEAVNNRP